MRLGLHLDARRDRARSAYLELAGPEATARRQAYIDRLPVVEWKGKRLVTLRCNGRSGKGPHDQNVPEALIWSLMDPDRWLCPFHHHDGQPEPERRKRDALRERT